MRLGYPVPRMPTGGRGRFAGVLIGASLAASCALLVPGRPGPAAPRADAVDVAIDATAVPLDPSDPSRTGIGAFHYAGGVALVAPANSDLHGLSAIVLTSETEFAAVGDLGVLFRGRVILNDSGHLVGVTDGRLQRLRGADGALLLGKESADAEGIALLPDGDLLVSFERVNRIMRYPADGGRPVRVPSPQVEFPLNGGMEALTFDAEAGDYLVGAEESGQTWRCRIDTGCVATATIAKDADFGVTAIARVADDRTAYLLRAFDPERGNRVSLVIEGAAGVVDRLDLARPLTVDNFEGLAVAPGSDGAVRFYLLSDDNANVEQRTLLLAFDWRP